MEGCVHVDLYLGVVVGNGAIDLYWGRCDRVCTCKSLLGSCRGVDRALIGTVW